MSWLSTAGKSIGTDVKKFFSWITSPKGQAVVSLGEGVAEAIGVPQGLINVVNYWAGKIIMIEGAAVAAGEQNGTGTQKAAAVLQDVTPLVLSTAKELGLPTPTADNLSLANTKLVEFFNALGATTPAASATTT